MNIFVIDCNFFQSPKLFVSYYDRLNHQEDVNWRGGGRNELMSNRPNEWILDISAERIIYYVGES